jgi:hypothetical protein
MEKWDSTSSKTWVGCPYRDNRVPSPEKYTLRCKERFDADLKERRRVESRCRGDELLPSYDVEQLVRALAHRLGIRDRKRFEQRAKLVNGLDQKSLRIVYRLFDDLLFLRRGPSRWFEVMRP